MKIKQIAEDFIVKEVLKLKLCDGPYNYYLLKKKNWNTLDVINRLTEKGYEIGYAGLKDRNAITEQYISIHKKKLNFTLKDCEFEFLGSGKERINQGDLQGNEFIITIRYLDEKLNDVKQIVNYFGEQRFSEHNVEMGKCLVKKDFKKVCELLELDAEGNDFVNCLRRFGLKKLKLFVHAYQSYLWNLVAKQLVDNEGVKIGDKLPIFGFLTKDERYEEIIKNEEITRKDFIIRPIPELSSEGSDRDIIVEVKDFKTLEFCEDELNQGKKKQVVSFYLPKGCYATIVVLQMIQVQQV